MLEFTFRMAAVGNFIGTFNSQELIPGYQSAKQSTLIFPGQHS